MCAIDDDTGAIMHPNFKRTTLWKKLRPDLYEKAKVTPQYTNPVSGTSTPSWKLQIPEPQSTATKNTGPQQSEKYG